MIFTQIQSLFILFLVLPSITFISLSLKKIKDLSFADQKAAEHSQYLYDQMKKIAQENKALLGLYLECPAALSSGVGIISLQESGQSLRLLQDLAQEQIRIRLLSLSMQGYNVNYKGFSRALSGPCELPGLLKAQSPQTLFVWHQNNSGFKIYENSALGFQWEFFHPQVFTL